MKKLKTQIIIGACVVVTSASIIAWSSLSKNKNNNENHIVENKTYDTTSGDRRYDFKSIVSSKSSSPMMDSFLNEQFGVYSDEIAEYELDGYIMSVRNDDIYYARDSSENDTSTYTVMVQKLEHSADRNWPYWSQVVSFDANSTEFKSLVSYLNKWPKDRRWTEGDYTFYYLEAPQIGDSEFYMATRINDKHEYSYLFMDFSKQRWYIRNWEESGDGMDTEILRSDTYKTFYDAKYHLHLDDEFWDRWTYHKRYMFMSQEEIDKHVGTPIVAEPVGCNKFKVRYRSDDFVLNENELNQMIAYYGFVQVPETWGKVK